MEVAERHDEVAGVPVRWLQAGSTPVLFLHGVPNSSDMWAPFLARVPGIALDLPGFGRSGKPAEFDYSIAGYDRFLAAFVEQLRLERFSLVLHDWGAVGLALAQRFPDRVERLVLLACVPFLPGYRWHPIARIWRRPLLGELSMGFSTRWGLKHLSRAANAAPGPLPDEAIDEIWRHFDHGTQRAILKLYRSAPEETLPRAGERLGEVRCPALVLWGEEDPYLPADFADAYGEALAGESRVERLEAAGHWLWLDRPEVIDRAARFLLK